MTEGTPPDQVRRKLLGGAVAVTLSSGVIAAIVERGAGDAGPLADAPAPQPPVGGGETLSGPATAPPTSAGGTPPPSATPDAVPATTPRPPTPGIAPRELSAAERRHHVARRLTYGPTPAVLAEIESDGIEAFVARQLDPASIDDTECEKMLVPLTLGESANQIDSRESGLLARRNGLAISHLQFATFVRAVHSRRQLHEVMVGFWTDHFNVWPGKERALRAEKPVDDETVARQHALGTFRDLLQASAHSPAMLRYLDNHASGAEDPNENYARELLELHTVGIGNYSESDVAGAARIFSGWGIGHDHRFRFDPNDHATGRAEVAGWSTEGTGGHDDGKRLLDHLAAHPATAHHVVTKLARRFVRDDPPAVLVDRLVDVYSSNDTAIVPVLAALFASDEFFAAYGTKLRRPFEFAAAAARLVGATVDTREPGAVGATIERLRAMGHAPFEWPGPDGYPDVSAAWLAPNDVMGRWTFAKLLGENRLRGIEVQAQPVVGSTSGRSVADVADDLARAVTIGPPPTHVVDAIVAASGQEGATPFVETHDDALGTMLATAIVTAEVQYR